MSIYQDNAVIGRQGFLKELDQKSTAILLDLTQENQYQYPVQSTIRELVSNAVDSVTEKFNALDILAGAPVEKYFVQKEGDIYHASGWKPAYFNPAYLSDKQTVRIEVEQRGQEHGRDLLRVIDEGVGLWGDRLEGYFSISYSTKRLNASTLGSFGIGAKAPLSMDVASFRMTTTYNGMRTAFDIFNRKIEPVYGPWNEQDQPRQHFTFSNGTDVFYDLVDAPNGVTIEVEIKKAERQNLLNAIRSQLLFFSTVELWVKQEYQDTFYQKDFLAHVLYEDEHLILSDNGQFSQPHLVLDNGNTKVCYGKIDFGLLELEQKQGNIGLKIRVEDVDIVPSREYVKWGAKTQTTVLKRFQQAQEAATRLVQEELKEDDPLLWLEKAANVWNNISGSTVLGRLSRIVDRSTLTPIFPGTDIKFEGIEQMFYGVKVRNVSVNFRSNGHTTSRADMQSWNQVNFDAFYVTKGNVHAAKDVQLYRKHGNFTLLTLPEEPIMMLGVDPAVSSQLDDEAQHRVRANYLGSKARYDKAMERLQWLLQSPHVLDYDSVVVDPEVEQELTKQEAVAQQQQAEAELTPVQLRKLEGKVFMNYVYSDGSESNRQKEEPTLKEVQQWPDTVPIVYGSKDDKEQLDLLGRLLYKQFRSGGSKNYYDYANYWTTFKLLQVSQDVAKKLPAHAVPVSQFFTQVSSTNFSLHPMLRPWYTCLQVDKFLQQVEFMKGFAPLHADMYAVYKELSAYVAQHKPATSFNYNQKGQETLYQNLLEVADKMAIFEQFTKDHATDTEQVALKSQELFGISTVTGSAVWDTDIQQKLEQLQLYCQPMMPLFNEFACLTNPHRGMSDDVAQGIRSIMQMLGVRHD